MTAMTRTDTHRPSFLDPAEYVEVGYADLHPEEGTMWMDPSARNADTFAGNFENRGRCDHCGAGPLRYVVFFLHTPTNTVVTVGERCAGVLALSSKTERERRAEMEQNRRRHVVENWKGQDDRNAEIAAWLEAVVNTEFENDGPNTFKASYPSCTGGTWAFLHDLLHKLNRWGNLSEKQVDAAFKIKARNDEVLAGRAAEAATLADVAPLAEGRYEIEGEIISHKWQESDYGDTHKMLVKMADGNKVWGTIPNSIEEELESWTPETGSTYTDPKGMTVTFTATVERSRDDEHFGFFKRPSKAKVTGAVS